MCSADGQDPLFGAASRVTRGRRGRPPRHHRLSAAGTDPSAAPRRARPGPQQRAHGPGPALPALAMALAVAADRARTTTRNGSAALRRHPMLFLPPLIVLLASAIVFMLMSVRHADHRAARRSCRCRRPDARHRRRAGSRRARLSALGAPAGQQTPDPARSPRRSRRHRPPASRRRLRPAPRRPAPQLSAGSPAPAHGSPCRHHRRRHRARRHVHSGSARSASASRS